MLCLAALMRTVWVSLWVTSNTSALCATHMSHMCTPLLLDGVILTPVCCPAVHNVVVLLSWGVLFCCSHSLRFPHAMDNTCLCGEAFPTMHCTCNAYAGALCIISDAAASKHLHAHRAHSSTPACLLPAMMHCRPSHLPDMCSSAHPQQAAHASVDITGYLIGHKVVAAAVLP